jgi:hypothetical protein
MTKLSKDLGFTFDSLLADDASFIEDSSLLFAINTNSKVNETLKRIILFGNSIQTIEEG